MRSTLPKLHVVTNNDVARLADLDRRAEALAHAGGVAFHARASELSGSALTNLAERLGRATQQATTGATIFVNDRVDVALLVDAAGVHLPAAGLPVETVRRLVGDKFWIGRSTHHPDEARRAAEAGADYVFLGPIWSTPSHPDRTGLGVAAIERAQPARVVAIGGVTPERVAACLAAGAYGVAAISALWWAGDPGSIAKEMSLLLRTSSP